MTAMSQVKLSDYTLQRSIHEMSQIATLFTASFYRLYNFCNVDLNEICPIQSENTLHYNNK